MPNEDQQRDISGLLPIVTREEFRRRIEEMASQFEVIPKAANRPDGRRRRRDISTEDVRAAYDIWSRVHEPPPSFTAKPLEHLRVFAAALNRFWLVRDTWGEDLIYRALGYSGYKFPTPEAVRRAAEDGAKKEDGF